MHRHFPKGLVISFSSQDSDTRSCFSMQVRRWNFASDRLSAPNIVKPGFETGQEIRGSSAAAVLCGTGPLLDPLSLLLARQISHARCTEAQQPVTLKHQVQWGKGSHGCHPRTASSIFYVKTESENWLTQINFRMMLWRLFGFFNNPKGQHHKNRQLET